MKKKKDKKSKSIIVLSIMFSLFLVIGYSYLKQNNWDLVFGNIKNLTISLIVFIICYLIIKQLLKKLYKLLDEGFFEKDKLKDNKIIKKFNQHPFIYSVIIIIICWLPYIISYFPAVLAPDPSYQIKQFFGIVTKYADYSVLLDPKVLITNHHPLIHTLLLGGCVKIGLLFNSTNMGLFLYCMIQTSILVSTLAFTVSYMRKLKLPNWFSIGALALYSLTPVFPFYAMSTVKDVIFGSFFILYLIMMYDFSRRKELIKIKEVILTIILMLLLALFRNNGIYVIVLSFPILIFINKINRKKLLIIFISVFMIFFGYSKVLLPSFKITPGSIRETLSIPFQQTARYVKEYGDDLSKTDKKNIDKLLNISSIGKRYDPDLSDPVKGEFNKYYTTEDLKKYFSTWFNGLIKHPDVYVEATINNTYGYFCPLKTSWYIYHKYDTRIVDEGFNYHYNSLYLTRDILNNYGQAYPYIPVLGLTVNIAFNVWMVMIMTGYLIYLKKYKELIAVIPSLILILVCVAGPANTYFRYALPYVFAMPITIGIFLHIIRKKR